MALVPHMLGVGERPQFGSRHIPDNPAAPDALATAAARVLIVPAWAPAPAEQPSPPRPDHQIRPPPNSTMTTISSSSRFIEL
jgi:hypothetical protein